MLAIRIADNKEFLRIRQITIQKFRIPIKTAQTALIELKKVNCAVNLKIRKPEHLNSELLKPYIK